MHPGNFTFLVRSLEGDPGSIYKHPDGALATASSLLDCDQRLSSSSATRVLPGQSCPDSVRGCECTPLTLAIQDLRQLKRSDRARAPKDWARCRTKPEIRQIHDCSRRHVRSQPGELWVCGIGSLEKIGLDRLSHFGMRHGLQVLQGKLLERSTEKAR